MLISNQYGNRRDLILCDKRMKLHIADDLVVVTIASHATARERRGIEHAIKDKILAELKALEEPEAQFLLVSVRQRIGDEGSAELLGTLIATPRPALECDTWRELLIYHLGRLQFKASDCSYGGRYVAFVEGGLRSDMSDEELKKIFFSFGDLLLEKGILCAI
jgi:hypothetical protein